MGPDGIRFIMRDGRIHARIRPQEAYDLGAYGEVRAAMLRFLADETGSVIRATPTPATEAFPPPEAPMPPRPKPPLQPQLEPEPRPESGPRVELDRSEERHELTIHGRIVTKSGPRDITVMDLSTHGCRFADRFRGLNPGDQITIKIGPIGPVRADVKWCRQGFVGIAFDNPLYPSVLDHIRNHFDIRR